MRNPIAPLLLIALAACSDRAPPEPEPQDVRPAKLMTVRSQRDDVVYEFVARVEALQSTDLSFEVGGTLAELPVLEGTTVGKGELVAALEPTNFQLAVEEAEVELQLASQDLERKRKVLAEDGIAKSVVEDAQSKHELERVRLRQARERQADTRLTSPFDAYVSRRFFDRFVNVKPGEPIVRLHDLTRLQVVISAPERLVATLGPEQLLRSWVEFGFAPGQEFDIAYHENRGEADALAQTYEVSFVMDNPQSYLILPGMTAAAKMQVRGPSKGAMLLPASALVPTADGGLSVWVYDPATSLAVRRLITADSPTQAGAPVTSGLVDGEQVVIAGASQIQDGMRIRPL